MMTFLQAAEAVATSEETRMGLWTLFTKGGWLMWPLLALGGVTIFIFVERFMAIRKASVLDMNFMNRIRDYISDGKIQTAVNLCKKTDTPIADTLRLEMGFCLYGNDLDDTTSPIEAGLGWITKFAEGKNFINRPMLEKQKTEGTIRKLVGFEMVDRGIPRHGYELFNTEGEAIGVVTSGTMSPTRKIGVGMGYVKPEYSKVGTEICIDMRGRKLKAVVVRPPFRK